MTSDDMWDWVDDIMPLADSDSNDVITAKQLKQSIVFARNDAKRRFVNGLKRQSLLELIPQLPPPDTDIYIVSNGLGAEIKHGINEKAFDFGTFVPVMIELLGNDECHVYISTWTLNRNHALSLLEGLSNNSIGKLVLLSDPYFNSREPAVAALLIEGIMAYPGRAKYLAFKNHCKIITISDKNKKNFCTITGSANLSSQPRCEQYVLTTSPDVHRFFVSEFFEAIINGQ